MTDDDVSGKSLKEWSMIILMVSLAFTFGIVGIGFALAIIYNPNAITFTGSFDLSQFTTIVVGVAMVAVTLVAQQLTSKAISQANKQNDEAWTKSP